MEKILVAIYFLKWIEFISFEKQNAEGTDVNPPQKLKNWPRKLKKFHVSISRRKTVNV
jgi:hypothetical protein